MAAKVDVNGPGRHSLYAWLTSEENGCPGDIDWNFEKCPVDAEESLKARYPSATTPGDAGLMLDLAAILQRESVNEPALRWHFFRRAFKISPLVQHGDDTAGPDGDKKW